MRKRSQSHSAPQPGPSGGRIIPFAGNGGLVKPISRPRSSHWGADTALVVAGLAPAQRPAGADRIIHGAAIVGQEDDKGIVTQAVLLKRVHDLTYAIVQGANHRCQNAGRAILYFGKSVEVLARNLIGGVGCVVREIEEERSILVGVDEINRMIGQVLGEVLVKIMDDLAVRTLDDLDPRVPLRRRF